MHLFYFFIYYHFNMQKYPLFQLKTRKIEKIEFFRALCVYTQKFLRDNFLMLCGSPKCFLGFSDTFFIFKILSQKNIFRKKSCTAEISGRKILKIGKSKNLADRPKSAKTFWGIKTCVLGGYAAV